LYVQFLDLYGNPVYVPPSPLPALRGMSVMWEGKPRAATLIVLPSREIFRVRGHVDTIKDAIEQWYRDERAKSEPLPEMATLTIHDCPNRADGSPMVCHSAAQPVSRSVDQSEGLTYGERQFGIAD
jgi:hypothetical protein